MRQKPGQDGTPAQRQCQQSYRLDQPRRWSHKQGRRRPHLKKHGQRPGPTRSLRACHQQHQRAWIQRGRARLRLGASPRRERRRWRRGMRRKGPATETHVRPSLKETATSRVADGMVRDVLGMVNVQTAVSGRYHTCGTPLRCKPVTDLLMRRLR